MDHWIDESVWCAAGVEWTFTSLLHSNRSDPLLFEESFRAYLDQRRHALIFFFPPVVGGIGGNSHTRI